MSEADLNVERIDPELVFDIVREGNLNKFKKQFETNQISIVGCKSDTQATLLHEAAKNGHFKLCEYLLETVKVDVNAKTVDKVTALMVAARNGSLETVEVLLKHPNIKLNNINVYKMTS